MVTMMSIFNAFFVKLFVFPPSRTTICMNTSSNVYVTIYILQSPFLDIFLIAYLDILKMFPLQKLYNLHIGKLLLIY